MSSEGLHSLTSHLGQLHLSTNTAVAAATGAGPSTQQHAQQQQQQQQYHLSAATASTPTAAVGTATHTAQYTTQPPGWTISPTAHYIQQVQILTSHRVLAISVDANRNTTISLLICV